MSDTPVDFRNVGALPTLGEAPEVLGAPESKAKSKTNVGKFAILGLIVTGMLFVLAGLMIWQKSRKPSDAIATAEALKPGFSVKNEALESDSIARQKAELKKQDDEEKARIKAIEDAQAEAQRQAEARNADAKTGSGQQQRLGPDGKPLPPPLTPSERRMTGGVLLDNTGYKPKPGDAPFTEKDALQREAAARAPAENAAGVSNALTQPPPPPGGESMASRLQSTALQARTAARLPDLNYLLKRGTSIPCALKTGIDTTLPGFVICEVLNDVYSANGKTLLVERGATVFGEQASTLKQGQERTFVVWSRIDNPNGIFANIDSPATDQLGYSGIPGFVDTHFMERFGGAIMISLIKDFSQAYSQQMARSSSGSGTTTQPNYQNTQQASQDMSTEALRNSINIPPTLYVRPATVVNVLVARDISFSNVFELVE